MKDSRTIHALAFLGLLFVAITDFDLEIRGYAFSHSTSLGALIFAIAVWALFFTMLCRKPRGWSIPTALVMLLMFAFEVWPYVLGIEESGARYFRAHGYLIMSACGFVPYLFTAVCCFILRATIPARKRATEPAIEPTPAPSPNLD